MSRRLIKFTRSENCIILQTISKDNATFRYRGKSSHFYMTKKEVENIFSQEGGIYCRDIYSFLSAIVIDGRIQFEVIWLNSNGHKVQGEIERFSINADKFLRWYNGVSETFKVLDMVDTYEVPKFDFYGRKLKEVLEIPLLRRKFVKKLMEFQRPKGTVISIYDDFMDYSFGWTEYFGDKREMNGGIILHKDYDNPDNLTKSYYGVHT